MMATLDDTPSGLRSAECGELGGRSVSIESLLVCMIGACYVSHFSEL